MKFFNGCFQYLFSDRFSVFDLLAIMTIVAYSNAYDNLWLLLLIIPISIFGAAMSIRCDRSK